MHESRAPRTPKNEPKAESDTEAFGQPISHLGFSMPEEEPAGGTLL